MASKYVPVKDEEELVRMHRAGLLYLDMKGAAGPSSWELCHMSEDGLIYEFRAATTLDYTFLPEEFAYLVDEDEEDNGC